MINQMEQLVTDKLEQVLHDFDNICTCQICVEDMMTYALNLLPSSYVSTLKGQLMTRANYCILQNDIDVAKAVTTAIEIVSHSPRH